MLKTEELLTYKFNARYTKSQCVRLFNPSSLQPSYSCISLMKSYEKLYKLPYWDQTGELISEFKKGATIGYGHLILSENEFNIYKNGITESQSVTLFKKDIYRFIQEVRTEVKEKLTQNEFDALVMLAFNIGIHAFKSSKILRIINGDLTENLKNAWKSFRRSQGHVSRGLINRREAELNVFFNGGYFKK